jgi:hypothetical protein
MDGPPLARSAHRSVGGTYPSVRDLPVGSLSWSGEWPQPGTDEKTFVTEVEAIAFCGQLFSRVRRDALQLASDDLKKRP